MQRCDEGISSLGAERASVGTELGRVQEILAVAVRPPTPPAGEASIVPIESLAPAGCPRRPRRCPQAAAPRTPAPQPAPQPAATPPAPASSFDELAFLQSVVDKPAPRRSAIERRTRADAGAARARVVRRQRRRAPTMIEPIDVEVPARASVAPSRRNAAPTPVLTSTPLVEKEGHEREFDAHAGKHSRVPQGRADRADQDAQVPGVRDDELPHRVVLRALRWRARGDVRPIAMKNEGPGLTSPGPSAFDDQQRRVMPCCAVARRLL